jgi:hypothetical protein
MTSARPSVDPLSFPVAIISSVDAGQKVVDDKICHCLAELFAGIFIRAKVLARVDSAQAGLVLCGREAVTTAHAAQIFERRKAAALEVAASANLSLVGDAS